MSTFQTQLPTVFKKDNLYICERSIYSAYHVFSKTLDLSKEEQFMLSQIFDGYSKNFCAKGIIYIKSSVKDNLKRARQRGYSSDIVLDLKYLEMLEENYNKWLHTTNIPVYFVTDKEIFESQPEHIIEKAMETFFNTKQDNSKSTSSLL